MRHKRVSKLHNDGLSPNGKALDSDSSIFQVRILVAQLIRRSRFDRLFILVCEPFNMFYGGNIQRNSTQTRSRSLPHIADTKLAKYLFYELSLSSLSADVLQWSAWEFVDMLHPYLHFDGSHINYKIKDRLSRLICLIYTKKKLPNKLESFKICGREDSNSRHLGP